MRPRKGELKANRAIVGTDARAVRPYIRMDNQLVNPFTLSTRQLKTGEAVLSLLFPGFNGLHDELFELFTQLGIVAEQGLGGIATLCQFGTVIAEPTPAFIDNIVFNAEVENLAHLTDALTEHDFELSLAERRCHFVLDNFYTYLISDDIVTVLDARDPPDIEADAAIELQSITARGGFGTAEHHANLLAQLVDKDTTGVGFTDS